MATNLEQLTVKVVVDSKGAEVGFVDLAGRAHKLNGQFLKLDDTMQIIEKDFQDLGEEAKRAAEKIGSPALKKAGETLDSLGQSTKKASLSFGDFAAGVVVANQAFDLLSKSVGFVTSTFGGFVTAFADAEKSQLNLEKALSMASDRVLNSATAWASYADSIEAATGEDADNIKSLIARSIQIGRSEEQTKKLIDASQKLAILTGGSLADAFSSLEDTYKGAIRGVALYDTSIKGLTQEQLANGAAVDAILKKYQDLKQVESTALSLKKFSTEFSNLKEDIGGTIVQVFEFNKILDTIKSGLMTFRGLITSIDFKNLAEGLGGFSTLIGTLAVTLLPAFRAQLLGVAASATAAVAPFASFALVATSVIGVAVTIELLARNLGKLPKLVDLFWNTMQEALYGIDALLHRLNISLSEILGLEEQKKKSQESLKEINKAIEGFSKKAEDAASELDLGFSGQIASEAKKAWDALTGSVGKLNTGLGKTSEVKKEDTLLDPEALKKSEEAAKKASDAFFALVESARKLQDIGATLDLTLKFPDASDAEKTYQIGLLQVEAEKQKALLAGTLLKAIDEQATKMVAQLEINKQLQEGAKITADIYAEQKKNIEDTNTILNKLNDDNIAKSMEIASIGATQQQVIENQLRVEMDKIDLLEEQLKLKSKDGQLNSEAVKQLQTARDLAEQNAAIKSAQAAGPMSIGTANEAVQGAIGAASPVGAFMGAAEAIVGAVQKLIDFIPNILNAIAKVFSSLADLPEMIFKAVVNVIQSAAKLISQFIPNLLAYIPMIIDEILTAVFETLPQAAMELLNKLPDLIVQFADKIPVLVEKFVSGITAQASLIAIGLVNALVKLFPLIVSPAFMMRLQVAIWKASVTGFINGIKAIGKAVMDLFKGIGPQFASSVTDGISTGIKAATDKVTGIGSQLFQVSETGPVGSAAEKGKEIAAQIEAAGRSAFEWLRKAWEAIKAVWRDYIFPIVDLLIIKPLKAVWDLGIAAFNASIQLFSSIWEGIKAGFAFIWNTGKAMFDAVIGTFQVLWEFAKGIFNNPIEAFRGLIVGLSNVFGILGTKLSEAFQPLINFVSNLFSGVGKIGSELANAAGEFASTVASKIGGFFDGIIEKFKTPINKLIDVINGMKTNALTYRFSEFGVTVSGTLVPAIDLIPGNIPKLNQGGPVPGTGFTDNQPALLTPGEFVMNRNAVRDIGLGTLERMNRTGQMASTNTANVSVNLTVNTEQPIDERFIKTRLVPTLLDEVRRESLRGAFVISGRGIK